MKKLNRGAVQHKYIWLDFMRGLAALEVFLGHLRTITFRNYWEGPTSLSKKLFYFFTGFSHEAVVVFFVLSGYFISDAVLRARDNSKFSIPGYAIDRIVRLWIVLVPGLILTWCVDGMGLHYFSSSPLYLGTLRYMGNIHVAEHLNFKIFLGNMFFLQNIKVTTFGSNGPLWSLSNEFWYYLLFPVFMFIFWEKRFWKKCIICVGFLGVFWFIGKDISLYFSIWLLGAALVFIKRNFQAPTIFVRNLMLAGGLLLVMISFYIIRVGGRSDFYKDFSAGLFTAILCYGGLFIGPPSRWPAGIITFLSGISYSLYVIHLPLCIFISAMLLGSQQSFGLKSLAIYGFISVMVFGITMLFWTLFESRYVRVRIYVKDLFGLSVK